MKRCISTFSSRRPISRPWLGTEDVTEDVLENATIFFQLPTANGQRPTANGCPLTTVHCPLTTVH